MLTVYPAGERFETRAGWLHGRHSFSFGEHYDPARLGFRALRVINDDVVAPGTGFGMHGHRDMEIITVVLEGELEHRDSLGHVGRLRPGEVQVMTAGTGIRHSEVNASRTQPVHLLQIWITPDGPGRKPGYAQKAFPGNGAAAQVRRVAGREGLEEGGEVGGSGVDGALRINQDADVLLIDLLLGGVARHGLRPGRGAWVHVATGSAKVNGQALVAGDGAALEGEAAVELEGVGAGRSQVLVFDMA